MPVNLHLSQSPDGKRLYVCSGDVVRVFCTVSGEPLGAPFVGHTSDVTTVLFHPAHPEGQVLLTASLDGTLKTWNAQDSSNGVTLTAPGPVENMAVATRNNSRSRDVVYLSCWKRGTEGDLPDGGRIHAYSIGKGRSIERLLKVATPKQLIINPSGTLLGTFDRHTVLLWLLSHRDCGTTGLSQRLLRLHHTKRLSVLACDITGNIVAAGDCTGRIHLWQGIAAVQTAKQTRNEFGAEFSSTEDSLPCTTFHWHSRSVECLSFTTDGAYLLSGGSEAVLVLWHLEIGQRSYLPRLGASLCGITPFPRDATRAAIAGADNAVRLISISSMMVERVIRGVKPSVFKYRSPASRLRDVDIKLGHGLRSQPSPAVSLDPGSGTIAFAAIGASLQLYDHELDRHVANLEISPRNFVGGDGSSDEPMEPYVSHATFSRDGSILVTVERRSEQAISAMACHTYLSSTSQPEETLRIWERQRPTSSVQPDKVGFTRFTCVCVCDMPHSDFITSTVIRGVAWEVSAMVCSVSVNSEVKMWIPTKFSRGGERRGWRCCSVLRHPGSPSLPLMSAAFSNDGSLIATASAEVVIWEPESFSLLYVLAPPTWDKKIEMASTRIITGLSFIAGEPLLAAASAAGLILWNMMTLNVWRTIAMPCVDVVAHPTLPQFVVTIMPQSDNSKDQVSFACSRNTQRDSIRLNRTSGCLVVQFDGSASPTTCWAMPGDGPQAVLHSSRAKGGIIIVTHDRKIVVVNRTKNDDAVRVEQESSKQVVVQRMLGTALKAFDKFELKQRVPTMEGNGVSTGIGSSIDVGGKNPWDDLFNVPSHKLPPLTNLAPDFLDALLERQSTA